MKNLYFFGVCLGSLGMFAQNHSPSLSMHQPIQQLASTPSNLNAVQSLQQSSYKNGNYKNGSVVDTVAYFDMTDMTGWTFDNDGQSGYDYGWANVTSSRTWGVPYGIAPQINSNSGGAFLDVVNGVYNNGSPTSIVGIEYIVSSPAIAIQGNNYTLSFQQYGALFNDAQFVDVSSDGINWSEVYTNNNRPVFIGNNPADIYSNPEDIAINLATVSAVNATSTILFVRFRFTSRFPANSDSMSWLGFGWMVDDVVLTKNPQFKISNVKLFAHSEGFQYTKIPTSQAHDFELTHTIGSYGYDNLGNVKSVVKFTTPSGILNDTVNGSPLLASAQSDTLIHFVSMTDEGAYSLGNIKAISDEDTSNDVGNYSYSFDFGGLEYALDRDTALAWGKDAGNLEYHAGNMFKIYQDVELDAITAYVSETTSNPGAAYYGVLWTYDTLTGSFDPYQYTNTYTIPASGQNTWKTLQFGSPILLNANSIYIVTVGTNGTGNAGYDLQLGYSNPTNVQDVNNLIYQKTSLEYSGTNSNWYFSSRVPMVRMKMRDCNTIQVPFSTVSLCEGSTVSIDAGNAGSTFVWENDPSNNQTIQVDSAGVYNVQITNGLCVVDRAITVTEIPVTIDLGADTTICAGQPISLNAGLGDTYLWSTGETSQTIQVGTSGNYSVTVNGVCESTGSIVIIADTVPNVFLGNTTTICENESISLDAGNAGATYSWSTGATSQTIEVSSADVYSVNVTNGMCSSTAFIEIQVDTLPVLNLGDNLSFCEGGSLLLDAGNPGATSYLWNTGATTQTIEISDEGTYSVEVVNNTCLSTAEVLVSTDETPSVHLGNDRTICDGSTTTLDAGNLGATYLWNTGATSQTITVQNDGLYVVTATLGDCISQPDSINITVATGENLTVDLGLDTIICEGSSITLDAGNEGATYEWNTNTTGQTIQIQTDGDYSVTVNNGVCQVSDTISITVQSLPEVAIEASSLTLCESALEDVTLTASGADVYLWDNQSTASTRVVSPTETTTYTVEGSIGNCSNSATVEIVVNNDCVGTEELNDLQLSIYPNPSNGIVYISSNFQFMSVQLTDLNGKILYQSSTNTKEIDLGKYDSGAYLLLLQSERGIEVRQIIKI